jgi:Holliday junction resolvase
MEINKKYLTKYLHDIAIEQIADDYAKRGYAVAKEEKLGKFNADIVARKGEEKIVIEIKSGKMTPDRKEKLASIADYVRGLGGYKFLVVIATPPKEKRLEIEGIESIITSYILNENLSELDSLSTHTTVDEVTDVDLDEIKIVGNLIFVKGDGVVSVRLQFGSDGDQGRGDGHKTSDNFPFEFEITLEFSDDDKLRIIEVDKLEVDTSSYYDD